MSGELHIQPTLDSLPTLCSPITLKEVLIKTTKNQDSYSKSASIKIHLIGHTMYTSLWKWVWLGSTQATPISHKTTCYMDIVSKHNRDSEQLPIVQLTEVVHVTSLGGNFCILPHTSVYAQQPS